MIKSKLIVPEEDPEMDDDFDEKKAKYMTIDLEIIMPRCELEIPDEAGNKKTYIKYFSPDGLTVIVNDKFVNWCDLVIFTVLSIGWRYHYQ